MQTIIFYNNRETSRDLLPNTGQGVQSFHHPDFQPLFQCLSQCPILSKRRITLDDFLKIFEQIGFILHLINHIMTSLCSLLPHVLLQNYRNQLLCFVFTYWIKTGKLEILQRFLFMISRLLIIVNHSYTSSFCLLDFVTI